MGKPKKNVNDEKGQSKISSFFANAPQKLENQSPLFSVVSISSKLNGSNKDSSDSHASKDDVIIIDSSPVAGKFKSKQNQVDCKKQGNSANGQRKSATALEFKSNGRPSIDGKGDGDCLKSANTNRDQDGGKVIDSKKAFDKVHLPLSDDASSDGVKNSISKAQMEKGRSLEMKKPSFVKHTSIKTPISHDKVHHSIKRSPTSQQEWKKLEDDIIPDTPDPLAKYANGAVPKKKRMVGRSFLSSSSFLKVGHQGSVESVVATKAKKANKYNKGRNFEDAYKEMQNSKHGDKGVMGDEEAMKTIMGAMGLPQVAITGEPASEKLFRSASEDFPVTQCSSVDNMKEKSDPKDSKLLTALDPDMKNVQTSKIERTSVLEQSGVKRPSSGGVSPNPKRPQPESKDKLLHKSGNLKENFSLKKKLFTGSSDLTKTKKAVKSDSWDSNVRLCDNDDTLNEILGEMKTPVQDRKDTNNATERLYKGKGSPLSPIDTNVQEVKESQDDIDPDEALDDILKELQGTLPTNVSYIEADSVLDTSLEQCKMNTSLLTSPEHQTKAGVPHKDNSTPVKVAKVHSTTSPKKEKAHSVGEKAISSSAPCASFGRHIVTAVERARDHVKLDVVSDPGKEARTVYLESSWMDTHIKEADVVNIIGDFNAEGVCRITNSENYLVVHPDLLLSGTSIVSAVFCMRKSVLNERFRGYEGQNVHMLYGSIIHSLFQEVLRLKVESLNGIREIAQKIVLENRTLHDVYTLGLHENAVVEEIEKYLPQIQKFLQDQEKYRNSLLTPVQNKPMVTKVADIEENIWSPRYGVKGKVDLSVQIKYKDPKAGWVQKLVPLELKTGKPSFSVEHKGQVMLYTMMMGDRGAEPDEGLLLYLKDGSMDSVPATYVNKKGLVQLRNEFAYHMNRTLQASALGNEWNGGLPRPINNPRACTKCPHLLNCSLFNRTLEGDNLAEDHPLSQLSSSSLQQLSPLHMSYFSHWVRLLHLEIGVTKSHGTSTKDLWCKPAELRENESQGIAGVKLDKNRSSDRANSAGQFLQTFGRAVTVENRPLQETGVSKGDQLVVSAMDLPLLSLAMGSVAEVTSSTITLTLDRDLQKYEHLSNINYRLDKVDFHSAMATNFNNLTRLMEENSCSAKLREVVVDKKRPEFDLTMPKGVIEKVKHIFKSLNKPQKTAVLKTLMCKDYVLIKGYPGTGKTSTIVSLVRILVALGFSVLLASYTHSAVDNILLKLKKHKVDFLRLGRLARVHPDIQPYASEFQTVDAKSVEDLQNLYQTKPVIATTCLGVTHGVFSRRTFDVCIVDEASQVLQPACFGPLYASKRFVLVGDPLQLPPVVQSKEAKEGGMAESLFARLDDTGATYELNLQYRMNKEIMRLSNELVYNGALKCGTPSVASAIIKFPQPENLPQVSSKWLKSAISHEEGDEVVFLDTSKIVSDNSGSKVVNIQEAKIALTIVQYYLKGGIVENDIGIITPYRKQVVFMRDLFSGQGHGEVEVNTVDQYQGRDKSVIIVSLVKSQGQESEILKDMRRLNVALTRAKHKLILIGAAGVLKAFEPMEKLLSILHCHQIVPVDLI